MRMINELDKEAILEHSIADGRLKRVMQIDVDIRA